MGLTKDMHGRPAWVQTTETCRHYNGVVSGVCRAGITYADVRGKRPLDLPCFTGPHRLPAEHACGLVDFPTEAEAKADQEAADAELTRYLKGISDGLCPWCGKPFTKKQVGRGVYAAECGHRLFQGHV